MTDADHPTRRQVLWSASAVALGVAAAPAVAAPPPPAAPPARPPAFDLRTVVDVPVKLRAMELLKAKDKYFVRATSTDGAVGVAFTSERAPDLASLLVRRVAPHFVGPDVRGLSALLDQLYVAASNYKLAGLPFWTSVAWCEFAVLDLLGRMANKSVGQMLGGVVRPRVPVYMSSLRRDTTPQQEVDWLKRRVDETGARAIKIKIGGRMSKNADASPGRTDRLVPLARKTFGDAAVIYVDANGSYDVPHAIEVGKMLQDQNVALYEEPCEYEDYDATRRVTEALTVPVAGGEQDTSLYRWRQMVDERVVDVAQPDVTYAGGFLRTIRVAEMAAERGMTIVPHSPKADANEAYLLHFVSRTPNAGPFHEYAAAAKDPLFKVEDGAVAVPTGPGLGVEFDLKVLDKAERVKG